ncbi:hypothetical protein CPAV1605_1260 [seawater metagenome]|uniref:Uncharacterized protein n=1 Tax=seawater metagenome TaxID=1561972 RepID=A0A5E8CL30_9ZZZZ
MESKWIKFKDAFPGIKESDWRRDYNIIKLGNTKKECKNCLNYYQKFFIDLHDMTDTFGFRYHCYYEPYCSHCEWYKYVHS